MNPIDVSIIVPVYNAAEYLDRCIVSLLRQTIKTSEIILVDDGSPDNSFEIASDYAKRFPERIIAVTQENQGPSAARNRALDLARGTYIGFLDADDWADTDLFQKLYLTAEQEQADLVVCGRFDVLSDMQTFRSIRRTPDTRDSGSSIFEVPELLSETTQFVWDKLFRRDIIEEHHIRFDERFRFTEDVLFLCQYKYYCKSISIIPDALCYHFQTDRDTTAKYGPTIFNVPDVLEEIFAFYSEKGYFKQVPDIFFDLAAKRLLFRVDRFPYMSTKNLQFEFCRRMFRVLKKYFPDWKKRLINYNKHGYSAGIQYLYRADIVLMWLYIYLPNPLKQRWIKFCQNRKVRIKERNTKHNKRKKHLTRYTDLLKNAYYRFHLDHSRVRDERVLIQSKGGREPAGNMLALLRESLNHGKQVCLSLNKDNHSLWYKLCERYSIDPRAVRLVQPNSYRFYKALATAAYLYNDSAFPHRFVKRKEQVYLNSWHGVPLKAMGCEVPGRAYAIGDVQRNLLLADYLIFPNPFMHEKMFGAYMLNDIYPGKIIQDSYPRVSVLTDTVRREELKKQFGLENKKVSCYLPTWRGLMTQKQNTKQYADCLTFLRKLDHLMTDDMVLYVKLHPYAQKGFVPGRYKHIRMFPEDFETYDFLTACDVLITDYSSVFFDYAVSGQKIVLFAYDYDEYKKDRGLYLDMESLPFPLVETVEDLYRELCLPKQYDDTDFMREFCPYEAAGSAERICRMLYKNENCCNLLVPEQRPVSMFYGELLEPSPAHTQLMQCLQHLQKTEVASPYLTGILSAAMRNQAGRINKLLPLSNFLSVEPDLYYTPLEALAHIVSVKRGKKSHILRFYLTRLYKREYRRNFGDLIFATIIFCTESDERHRLIFASSQDIRLLSYKDGIVKIEEVMNQQ